MSSNIPPPAPINKRIITAGNQTSSSPNSEFVDGTKVIFDYRVTRAADSDSDDDHVVLDDSTKDWPGGYGQPMEIIFGKKFKLPIWEHCLRTMRAGETSEFLLEPRHVLDFPFVSKQLRDLAKTRHHQNDNHDHHHHHHGGGGGCMGSLAQTGGLGYPELDEWLKSPEPLRFTFNLHRILAPGDYEPEAWTLTAEQKLSSIPSLQEAGNEHFRQGRLGEAEREYGEALGRLDSLLLREKPGEPEWVDLDRRKTPFYANLAQLKLNQREYYAAVEAASEALKRDPANAKALLRRAKAQTGAWNLAEARGDLEQLRRLDEETYSGMVDKELDRINQLEKTTKSHEAARFRNIFTTSPPEKTDEK